MPRTRLVTFLAFMGAFAALFQIGSLTAVDEEAASLFMEEFEKLVLDIDAVGIFVHNTTIALPMFIPGFGAAWGLFSAWSTGYAFAAITTDMPHLEGIQPLAILFLSPFGLMELTAYSLGISRSVLVLNALLKKAGLRAMARPALLEVGAVVALLAAGGFVEHYMIELAQEGSLEIPGIGGRGEGQ